MTLVLDLIGPPRLMGARNRCELRSGSLTIGRSPEADWVIPDVDRLISRSHLRIDASNGDFVLTDMSSNGVYLNANDVPVGYGASAKLRDGDELRVGEARITVTIEGAPDAPQSKPPNGGRDPLGGPFGEAASPELSPTSPAEPLRQVPRQTIDANWMIQPGSEPPSRAPQDGRDGHVAPTGPVPGQAAPAREALNGTGGSPRLLALVEQHPELSARRLAEAVDAAAQTIEASAWQALHHKVNLLVS